MSVDEDAKGPFDGNSKLRQEEIVGIVHILEESTVDWYRHVAGLYEGVVASNGVTGNDDLSPLELGVQFGIDPRQVVRRTAWHGYRYPSEAELVIDDGKHDEPT